MRIKTRTALILLTVATITMIAAVVFQVGPYRERNSYRCDICFAERDEFRWWFGAWGAFAIPISGRSEIIGQTKFGQTFLPEHTQHRWVFAQGSPYYWGSRWGGCALGSGRHASQTFAMYEESSEFRAFIDKKISAGRLTRFQVVEIFSEPSREASSDDLKQKYLLDEFFDAEATK